MISPSIGRIVWFHPGPNDPPAAEPNQPYAATVCRVWNDRLVNLSVTDGNYIDGSLELNASAREVEPGVSSGKSTLAVRGKSIVDIEYHDFAVGNLHARSIWCGKESSNQDRVRVRKVNTKRPKSTTCCANIS